MITLGEKIKTLRKAKNISQEKLAQYLGVSFQAISKWENDNACPDIALLPDIARFFGITVDELLQVEKLDEQKLFEDYLQQAYELQMNGKSNEILLTLWLDAYKKMPNNVAIKEMLMSIYYDTDKIKYKDDIINLASEIYAGDASHYYKGQAIKEAAITYAENGNIDMAEKWAQKSFTIHQCQEAISFQFYNGEELLEPVRFFTYWFFNTLCYMAYRINSDDNIPGGSKYQREILKTVVNLYETLYENDDLGFEDIGKLYNLHMSIAEHEVSLTNNQHEIQHHITRAAELVKKSLSIKNHEQTLPLLKGWKIHETPSENSTMWANCLKKRLKNSCFDSIRSTKWFKKIEKEFEKL